VLNAVIYPARQLGMTIVLLIFVIYIFASFIFFLFPEDFADDDSATTCSTLVRPDCQIHPLGVSISTLCWHRF
jgi:hypothetical protein